LPHIIVEALELHRGDQDLFEKTTTESSKVHGMGKEKKPKKSSTVIDEMFTVMEQLETTVATCK
jgi:hypothetical protein